MAGNDSYTVSLLHMNGVDASVVFTDGAFGGTHTWTTYGNAQIDTAQSKFGGASGLFAGDGDYLSTPDSDDWYFAAGNFTIDFWVRFLALPNDYDYLVAQDDGSADYMWGIFRNNSGNKLGFYAAVGGVAKANYIMTNDWGGVINTWYHIAVVRNGTSLNIYIDGVSQTLIEATVIGTNDLGNLAQPLYIGAFSAALHYFNGWIDELRISKGIARWTANFSSSLPTGEWSEGQPTIKRFGGVPFVTPNRGVWHRPPKLVTPTMREILKYNIGVW